VPVILASFSTPGRVPAARFPEPLTLAPVVRHRRRRRPKGSVAALALVVTVVLVVSAHAEVARRASDGAMAQRQLGSDSATGSRLAVPLLTVVASCRQQGRPLLAFLVAAVEAALRSSSPPSLNTTRRLNDYAAGLQTVLDWRMLWLQSAQRHRTGALLSPVLL
jgi:hypothetical protein